jgi:hypothetical protein
VEQASPFGHAAATAIAPLPVPTSAMRALLPPSRAQAAAARRSVDDLGVITRPGALRSVRQLKAT